MSGKHSEGVATSGFFGISPTRARLAIAGGVIAALVIGSVVWILTSDSDDDIRPSLIVIPTAALSAPPEGVITADPFEEESPTPAAPGSPRSDPPPPTTQPAPTTPPATRAPASTGLAAQYVLGSSWNEGFVSNLFVANRTGTGTPWQVRLTYPADVEIAVTGFWNATASVSGTTLVLDGGPLAPNGQVQAGFQATKNTAAQVDPTSCTINGTPCAGF
ncbi:cellulose binding domain-containing protein [Catenuloplanes atrovinosus]|uniref:Cellulase/cellobiase CelA1 n=1 Tax=Catenuloplanes atrovinosus TaxID=137266 RepID=A0AAE3YV16_9ACTN|nr:cellulose binding domain-containing protein [Catenuloplanes atrovinosus]MDR7279137.1 cellulase/cellobiase CelA1 [Catenuloplanes atrovinosus]